MDTKREQSFVSICFIFLRWDWIELQKGCSEVGCQVGASPSGSGSKNIMYIYIYISEGLFSPYDVPSTRLCSHSAVTAVDYSITTVPLRLRLAFV